MKSKHKSKSELGRYFLSLALMLSVLGFFALVGSQAAGGSLIPQVSTSTTTTGTTFSTVLTSVTTTSVSTSFTSSTTSTTTTSTSSSFSYTTTVTSTSTSTSTSSIYTSTVSVPATSTATVTSPGTSVATITSTSTTSVFPSVCPVALATSGTSLEPYANFLRGFRNDQIQNTTAGRMFMQTFNGWYYSWAPSVSYAASVNPWLLGALRVGVVPLIGILYASYYSYTLISPFSAEAGALTAGAVAASLIGLVYVAPVAYVGLRLVRRRVRLFRLTKTHALPALGWVSASALMVGAAYLSASGWLMGLGTASLTLSFLSSVSILSAVAFNSIQPSFANVCAMFFASKRGTRYLR